MFIKIKLPFAVELVTSGNLLNRQIIFNPSVFFLNGHCKTSKSRCAS